MTRGDRTFMVGLHLRLIEQLTAANTNLTKRVIVSYTTPDDVRPGDIYTVVRSPPGAAEVVIQAWPAARTSTCSASIVQAPESGDHASAGDPARRGCR